MLSFDNMAKIYNNVNTIGQELKIMSDEAIQDTFDNNIGTKLCYIYDYFHDDQPEALSGYDPSKSLTKIPVKLRFIVKAYKSAAKDDPEYHIMFEPDVWNSMSCKPDWFDKEYGRLGINFPIGNYVDIPDDRGIYHKWIIFYYEQANQFPKFGVMQCNYNFMWMKDDGIHKYKRKMWGVDRSQSSYTSGKWTGNKITTLDNQDKFWLPWNRISSEIRHDMRFFISMIQDEPYVYQISKVNNTSPKGMIEFTVVQDEFNKQVDFVDNNPDSPTYGEMYANYYSSAIEPEKEEIAIDKLIIEPISHNIEIGFNMDIHAKLFDLNGKEIKINDYENINWTILLNDVDVTNRKDIITLLTQSKQLLTIQFLRDSRFVGKMLEVKCNYHGYAASTTLTITH